MKVGVPAEIKGQEFRVGLAPSAVREVISAGHEVLVQRGAAVGIGMSDSDYVSAGATVVDSAEEVFARAELIVKVKEPQASEWRQLRQGQILFTYLHLAPDAQQARGLMASGATAIAYETVTAPGGSLPLLAPMSEIAGRLAVEAAAFSMRRQSGGRGVLLGGVPGVKPANVVILGGGVVGTQAARMAAGLGASVVVIDRSINRLRQLDDMFAGRICTVYSTAQAIETALAAADVVVGAALIPGAHAPKLVTRKLLAGMRKGTVLVDVSIDQGGCFETSRPTTHDVPTYIVDDIIHYCVANMPGCVPLTATQALNNATLPFVLVLAERGLGALDGDPHLKAGLNVHEGVIVHNAVARSLGFSSL